MHLIFLLAACFLTIVSLQNARLLSSVRNQQPGSLPEYQVDPYRMLEDDLKDVYTDVREVSW